MLTILVILFNSKDGMRNVHLADFVFEFPLSLIRHGIFKGD